MPAAGALFGRLADWRIAGPAIGDVDMSRRQIHIKAAKEKRDRITVLSAKASQYLEQYLTLYTPQQFVFEGLQGKAYSLSSVQVIYR